MGTPLVIEERVPTSTRAYLGIGEEGNEKLDVIIWSEDRHTSN